MRCQRSSPQPVVEGQVAARANMPLQGNVSKQSERFGRSTVRSGVVITDIDVDSPAERAGLRRGDVIREINRKPVKDVLDFERLISQLRPNASVLLLLNRGNATIFLSITPDG